jgi:RNA polymerase sigma factor (sigma-70 family)
MKIIGTHLRCKETTSTRSANVKPEIQDKERVTIEWESIRESLVRIVNRMTRDPFLRDDLMQEATIHFWKVERARPGETASWYIQSCSFHLRHYLASGRSVDSLKRRALQVELAEEEERLSESVVTDVCVIGQVQAREIVHQLSRVLTPREQAILHCLADGLGLREIACRLKFSHPVAIKCRRKIAELAVRMGIVARPATTTRRTGAGRTGSKVRRRPVPVASRDGEGRDAAPTGAPSMDGGTRMANGITAGMISDQESLSRTASIEKADVAPSSY